MRPPIDVDRARAALTANALAQALEHHARGRLPQAEAGYRKVLQSAPEHPDALARCWAALQCPTSGDVLLSAAPGFEFPDWGGVDHLGGGSHGSLHHSDSLSALLFSGIEARARQTWGIQDVAGLCVSAFGLDWPGCA